MNKRHTYSDQARKRIDAVVKRVEQQRIPPNGPGQSAPPGMPFPQVLLGKTAAAIPKGQSGTINLYFGTTKGSEDFASFGSRTVTNVYNRFGDMASGKWVWIIYSVGGWEILQGEC